jgi:peptide deformylase
MPASTSSTALLPDDLYALTAADKTRAAEEQALGMVAVADPALNKPARAVAASDIHSPAIQKIIGQLYVVAQGQRDARKKSKEQRTLVGLPATQIGHSLRIVLVDTYIARNRKRPGRLECFINPEIIWRSRETEEGREGCFSAGPVWGLVRRSAAVKVRAFDREGKLFERILEDFTARIALHEIDHLDGIRFADRIKTDRKRHWVHAEELEIYPKHVKHWKRRCSRERWERLKAGKDNAPKNSIIEP